MSGFTVESLEKRVSRTVAWFAAATTRITDFSVGSITRTKLETLAQEMELQDFNTFRAIRKAIPVSVYQAFGFNLLPAVKATGVVTFTAPAPVAADLLIPAGTPVSTGTLTPVSFETIEDATITTGQSTVSVTVECLVAGSTGNVGAASIDTMVPSLPGVASVTNANSFTTGSDVETETARAARFQAYVLNLGRSTVAGLVVGVKTAALYDNNGTITERVTDAVVVEPDEVDPDWGVLTLYIFNGVDGASAELLVEAKKVIDGYEENGTLVAGYKSAGVKVTVLEATVTEKVVTAELTIATGYDETTTLDKGEEVVGNYLGGLRIGESLIRNELIERLMGINGVTDCTLTLPAANETPTVDEVFRAGVVTITAA